MKSPQQVRSLLISQLQELELRLNSISNDVRHVDHPPEQDFSEQVTENENNEVLDALGNSTRKEVDNIRLAINKIDAGSYGICSMCGAAIRPERLEALPYVSLCIDCAQQHENR